MGEPGGGAQPDAPALEALRKKLEELEALGVPTDALRKTLVERPQDFEREAEAALRRELQGGLEPAPGLLEAPPVAGPTPPPPSESGPADPGSGRVVVPTEALAPLLEVRAPDAPGPESPSPTPAPVLTTSVAPPSFAPASDARTGAAPGGEAPPSASAATTAPEEPPSKIPDDSDLAQLEATVAALVGEPALSSPAPHVIEAAPEAPEAVEADLAGELEEALENRPADGAAPARGPPLLSSGDAFSLAPRPTPALPLAQPAPAEVGGATAPGPKPPPPSAREGNAAQTVRRVSVAAPPGAKPAPARPAPSSGTEVLPTTEAPRRRALVPLLAVVLLFGLFAGTYLLLVNSPPAVAFSISPSSAVAGDLVLFSANNTADPNGDPVTFFWQFGDGTNATGRTASHTYAHSGNFTVTLTATDDHGNAAPLSQTVHVTAGTVVPPAYRYGDSLDYAASGYSHVEGSPAHTPLATVNFTLAGTEQTCNIEAVGFRYDGPQTRSVLATAQTAADGFLNNRPTFALERSLPTLVIDGQVNTTCQDAPFHGSSALLERAYANPQNNDTIRLETEETTDVRVATDPPTDLSSRAQVTQFSRLGKAGEQLHLESVYALRAFSTEGVDSGTFVAEGLTWSWLTEGTEVVRGHLTVKVHLETNQPPRLSRLTVDLWVSSASPFPLREAVSVRLIDIGRITDSSFTATASAEPAPGIAPIPFGDGTRNYPAVNGSELAPLAEVPRSSLSADFALTARSAYDQSINASADFANYMTAHPTAYAVNGTYTKSGGNPKWMLEFSFGPTGETKRCEVEQSTSAQVRCGGGTVNAVVPRGAISSAVSMNYAADLLKREPTASALFPSSSFDAAHANFTIQQDLRLPSLSLDAGSTAFQQSVPYAFGVASYGSQPTRITAAVDGQGGQLLFVLSESGDRLP